MKFGKFNKERLFNIDTTNFTYTTLEELYNANGADEEYQLLAVYIGTKSAFDPETPLAAIEGQYVNLPVHQLPEIKAMLADRAAVAAINAGEAGFKIETYYKAQYKKTCYRAVWIDYDASEL